MKFPDFSLTLKIFFPDNLLTCGHHKCIVQLLKTGDDRFELRTLTFWTSIKLHPHWYVLIPSPRMYAYITSSYWREKAILYHTVLISIPTEILYEKITHLTTGPRRYSYFFPRNTFFKKLKFEEIKSAAFQWDAYHWFAKYHNKGIIRFKWKTKWQ